MTQEREDKIIEEARAILERRMGTGSDIKVNPLNIMYYGAYYEGALAAVSQIVNYCLHTWRGEERAYIEAELKLILSSKRNMQLFLDGTAMRYRNHKSDKKGKLESVECYFVE